jgi:hypothetical protein
MENKTLSTVLTIGAFILGVVGLVMGILIMAGSERLVGSAITLVMIVMGVGAAVALLFGLFHLFANIKNNVSLLIGLVGFAILAFICYSLASGEVLQSYDADITSAISKLSGGGLIVMYFLVGMGAVTAILGEIVGLFK